MAIPLFVLTAYDREEKIITMDVTDDKGKKVENCEKKGLTVDEFKKLIHGKYPTAIIKNQIPKEREGFARVFETRKDEEKQPRSDLRTKDIERLMRNTWED